MCQSPERISERWRRHFVARVQQQRPPPPLGCGRITARARGSSKHAPYDDRERLAWETYEFSITPTPELGGNQACRACELSGHGSDCRTMASKRSLRGEPARTGHKIFQGLLHVEYPRDSEPDHQSFCPWILEQSALRGPECSLSLPRLLSPPTLSFTPQTYSDSSGCLL